MVSCSSMPTGRMQTWETPIPYAFSSHTNAHGIMFFWLLSSFTFPALSIPEVVFTFHVKCVKSNVLLKEVFIKPVVVYKGGVYQTGDSL